MTHATPAPVTLLPTEDDGVKQVSKFFRALADPTRLRLLELCLHQERSVGECVELIGLAQSRISSHFACLADCGYVQARREGRRTFYSVTDARVAEIVLLARALAADNSAALADCIRIDS